MGRRSARCGTVCIWSWALDRLEANTCDTTLQQAAPFLPSVAQHSTAQLSLTWPSLHCAGPTSSKSITGFLGARLGAGAETRASSQAIQANQVVDPVASNLSLQHAGHVLLLLPLVVASRSPSDLASVTEQSLCGVLRRSALAMQTSCRSPCEKLLPFSLRGRLPTHWLGQERMLSAPGASFKNVGLLSWNGRAGFIRLQVASNAATQCHNQRSYRYIYVCLADRSLHVNCLRACFQDEHSGIL